MRRIVAVVVTFTAIAVVLEIVFSIASALLGLGPTAPYQLDDWGLWVPTLATLFSALIATGACVLFFKAPTSLEGPVSKVLWGALFGALAASVACAVPGLFNGSISISADLPEAKIFGALQQAVVLGPTAVGEELLLRGVAFWQLARFRPWLAVVGTSVVFGALHWQNPNVSGAALLNVALVGLCFGAFAYRTGTVWSSIGAHLAWNWCEGFLWGTPVSGLQPGRAMFRVESPAGFFSGGAFGPEASGWTSVVLAVAFFSVLRWVPLSHDPRQSTHTRP